MLCRIKFFVCLFYFFSNFVDDNLKSTKIKSHQTSPNWAELPNYGSKGFLSESGLELELRSNIQKILSVARVDSSCFSVWLISKLLS
jgi:hypothetical protein